MPPKPHSSPNLILTGLTTKKHLSIFIPFTISKESLTGADIVLVTLQAQGGETGVGEASPFPSLTGDTVLVAYETIKTYLPELYQKSTEAALDFLKTRRDIIRSQSVTAFTALEMAVWDLHGKLTGQSLSSIWGNANLPGIETDITMPIMPSSAVGEFWQLFAKYNFPIVKVKVSGHVDEDIAMIEALKKITPSSTKFTLDGNQAYQVETAAKLVQALDKIKVHPLFFEQPLAEDDWSGHKTLSSKIAIPICLDETVKTVADAQRVVREQTASMINLKIMKSGISETLGIIDVAVKNGIKLMIGGMFETEIAMGTSLQMACGTGKISFVDLDTPFFMTERITKNSAWHESNAYLRLPPGFGHGMIIEKLVVPL